MTTSPNSNLAPNTSQLAPIGHWSHMGTADHFVQFYEADGFLMDEVGRFIGTGLGMGDAVVVLATRSHLDGFEERLAVDGVDVVGARERGQYVALDAAETLAAFMTDGGPDERRFAETIGTLIARALAVSPGRRVRAFGEMVALLLAEGKEDAALRLEGLWNTLARSHTFALFCAYPARGFPRDAHGGSLARICAEHSHVIPSESYTRLASAQARLRSITLLQQKAAALDAATVERKELEKVLHRREQELADFFEHAMEGLQQLGPDRTILWANAAQLDLLGYTAVEYIGHDLAEFGVAPKKDVEDLWRRLTRGESLVNYPAELRCKNGSVRHVLLHASGLWENGSLVYARCFVRDVTERKRLEAELQSKLEQLAEMDRRKDEFLAVLSHELRTPLNTMLGWVRMLRTGQLEGARTSHALEVIERSTRTQARLIDDLLDVSRIITGKFVLEARPVSLIAVIEAALEAVTTTAEAKTITIINMLDPSSASVWGDPVRLQQVVVNLVSNAIKFTPAGGRVEVRLDRDGSAARLTVVDTGQGIHPDFLPHIFDPFRQADGSSTRAHGGLGLGLAIVRNLVELHKGSVEAESAGGGKGATFRVRFPLLAVRLQHETSADRAARSTEWAAVRLEGTRVLVVDDDADTRSLLSWTLERVGAQVEAVATASDALAAIERARPDVLLSDIALPGWNGHDLIRHLRAMSDSWAKTLPAIALSAFASEDDAARTRAAGFQIHVPKPMDPGALVQIIASLVKDRTA